MRAVDHKVLMVSHNWGGGTEKHVMDLRRLLEESGVPSEVCRPKENDRNVLRFTTNIPEDESLEFRIDSEADGFAAELTARGISHLHIHSLVGFSEAALSFFPAAAGKAGISFDFTVHDYLPICPRINLIGVTGYYCGEPAVSSCQLCIDQLGSPVGSPDVASWRLHYAAFMRKARRVIAPSKDAADRVNRHLPQVNVKVLAHPESETDATSRPSGPSFPRARRESRRVGLLGVLAGHKGSRLLAEVANAALEMRLPIDFVVIGPVEGDPDELWLPNVKSTGPYEDAQLQRNITASHIDLLWFPAVWPETYSFTLSAALLTRLPIVAFDMGAIAERLREAGRGELLPPLLMLDPQSIATHLASASGESWNGNLGVSKNGRFGNFFQEYYELPAWRDAPTRTS